MKKLAEVFKEITPSLKYAINCLAFGVWMVMGFSIAYHSLTALQDNGVTTWLLFKFFAVCFFAIGASYIKGE